IHESRCMTLGYPVSSHLADRRADELIPDISPTIAPEPFLPLLAPSPLTPFTNSTIPKLSGLFHALSRFCTLCSLCKSFARVESTYIPYRTLCAELYCLTNMMMVTSTDCMAAFAPLLANVVCCPQVEATLVILIGQSSKHTNTLALNGSLAAHCLSDFEQILVGQGANDSLSKICSVHSSNLTEGSCPVSDVESTVDSANLLAACGKIDIVNECCEQLCQNAILDAATKLAQKAYNLMSLDGSHVLSDHSTRINDCKTQMAWRQT
ncbi:UNVERIFIED_CONTAM: putative GPI-anchored protein, partial [Sesamum angustifolium]